MIVKLKTCLQWHGRVYNDGDEIDLPDNIASRYIATNQADAIPAPTPPVIETAATRTQPPRGRKDNVRTQATR